MANHTATHLLHYALRSVIGSHAAQAGSLVSPERLRFDFNHYHPLTGNELDRIESLVNEAVLANIAVQVHRDVTMDEAKNMGAIMLFDEKYGELVRVVQIDDLSKEFCGGTHTRWTGDIGLFKILWEGSVAAGVRRIEAATHMDAYLIQKQNDSILKELSGMTGTEPGGLPDRVRALQDEIASLKRKLRQERRRGIDEVFDPERDIVEAGKYRLARVELKGVSAEEMRELSDRIRTKGGMTVAFISSVQDGRVSIVLSASDEAVKSGVHAGRLLQKALASLGGKGGGRPHLAQGGGIEESEIAELLKNVEGVLAKL